MLTIPEEFLLLTIKDEQGGFVVLPPESLSAGFVGAAIMELALQDRIDSDLERIWVVDKTPTGEASVDVVLARMSASDFDPQADKLIDQLVDYGDRVRELALDRLVERNILKKEEGRVLWFLKARRYPVIDGKEIREAKLRLLEILMRDEIPGPRDVCLLSLAETCDMIRDIVPPYARKHANERLAALTKMDLIGQSVARYITIFQDSIVFTAFMGPM
jgi:Golgi phosphoprotein 3